MPGIRTQVVTGNEGRDPSPSLKPVSTESSDDTEPWDERKRVPSPKEDTNHHSLESMIANAEKIVRDKMNCEFYDDKELEDGDLPALSIAKTKKVSGNLTWGETTKRPLSPPSTKGMDSVKDNDPPMRRSRATPKQKRPITPRTAKQISARYAFWSQLDVTPTATPVEEIVAREEGEFPDDEMNERRAARSHELDDVARQLDEELEDEEYLQNAPSNSFDEQGGTCMEVTLASISNICGRKEQSSTSKEAPPVKPREPKVADDAEEHTAIEVEYVDPGPHVLRTKKNSVSADPKELPISPADDGIGVEVDEADASAWTSARKTAVLVAMARKAKQDFEKLEEEKSKQPTDNGSVQSSSKANARQDTNDIYNSFNPSEKRKFLKLINLGLTPTESSNRVVEERDENESENKAPDSASKKRFSFWKKNKDAGSVASAPVADRSVDTPHKKHKDATSVASAPVVDQSMDKELPAGDEGEDTASAAASAAMSAPATHNKDRGTSARTSTYFPATQDEGVEVPVAGALVEDDAGADSEIKPAPADSSELMTYTSMAGLVATGAGAAAIIGATGFPSKSYDYEDNDDEGSTEDEDDGVRGQFPKSGISYYDGVRGVLPEEEDSEEDMPSPSVTNKTKPSLVPSLPISPRSLGFNSLKSDVGDKDVHSSASEMAAESEASRSVSPQGRQAKSSNQRSNALSPDISINSRRRYLGLPIRTGTNRFAPLEEEQDGRPAAGADEILDSLNYNSLGFAIAAVGKTETSDNVDSLTEEQASMKNSFPTDQPLDSMDDPFFGLDEDEAKRSKDQVTKAQAKDQATEALAKDQATEAHSKDQPSEADISLDSYLDSATMQMYGGSVNGDHMSVFSGKSSYTAGTGMTGMTGMSVHTQSSRKRRPGAAKIRIAKAREAAKAGASPKGWHESIQAAAESHNRKWDPKIGWVDYKEPTDDKQQTPNANERLRISLDGVSVRSTPRSEEGGSPRQIDEGSQSPSVPVAFLERSEVMSPSGRSEMHSPRQARVLGAPPLSPRQLTDSSQLPRTPVLDQEPSPRSRSSLSEDSPTKPQGWLDSMRAAANEVSKDGRSWDPKKGWVGLDKNVIASSPLTPTKASEKEKEVEPVSTPDSTLGRSEADDGRRKGGASPNSVYAALLQVPAEDEIKDARALVEAESDAHAREEAARVRKEAQGHARALIVADSQARAREKAESLARARQEYQLQARALVAAESHARAREEAKSHARALEEAQSHARALVAAESHARDREEAESRARAREEAQSHARALVAAESHARAREDADLQTRALVEAESHSTMPRFKETKIDSWLEKSAKPSSHQSELSTEGSDQAVVAKVGTEKYVQLGENGAVRSVRRKGTDKDDKSLLHPRKTNARAVKTTKRDDEDRAPLLADGSSDSTEERGPERLIVADEASHSTKGKASTEGRAPEVKVVKQKVDDDDINLFAPRDDVTPSVSESNSFGSPSRRGTGPVDVDDIDLYSDSDSDDGDDHEPAWAPDSFMQGQVSPGMFVKPKSVRTVESLKLTCEARGSPKTPKLEKSRRDTFPIRSDAGKSREIISSPSDVFKRADASKCREIVTPSGDIAAPVLAPQTTRTLLEELSSAHEEESHAIQLSPSADESVESRVKMMAQQWESRAVRGVPIVQDISDSFDYDDNDISGLGDFSDQEVVHFPESALHDVHNEKPAAAGTQEWKSFLGKKVQAETAAAASREGAKKQERSLGDPYPIPRAPGTKKTSKMERDMVDEQRIDSDYTLNDGSPAYSATSATARRRDRSTVVQSSPGGFSDVSPIPPNDEFDMAETSRMEMMSDTGTAVEQGSFMKRLSACAAPISRALTGNNSGDAVPSAHLAFMRSNPQGSGCNPSGSGMYVPATLCGRPDPIVESEDDEDANSNDEEHTCSPTTYSAKSMRAMDDDRSEASSFVSESFGARTSYLEAIAMKTAVSKKKSKKSRRRSKDERSQASVTSDATTESKLSHSERWQAFLERKASQTASPPGSRTTSATEVSRAAEKYATGKVEEMMEAMASRPKSATPKGWRSEDAEATFDTSGDSSASPLSPLPPYRMTTAHDRLKSSSAKKKKSESVKAAEELAAARVEAMMAAMTSSSLDEGEI